MRGYARRLRDAEYRRRLDQLAKAFNEYPPGSRQNLICDWPDLFYAVSRLVRYDEVSMRR